MTNEQKAPVGQLSIDTTALMKLLRQQPMGALVAYQSMDAEIGRPVRAHRHLLETAIKRLWLDEGIYYDVVQGEGLKRVDEAGALAKESRRQLQAKRQYKRSHERLTRVDPAKLSEEDRNEWAAMQTTAGLVELMTGRKGADALRKRVAIANGAVPPAAALDLFKS